MQLERILFNQGFGTRKTCRALVRSERVLVNGQACDDPFADFDTLDLQFSVDGETWQYRDKAYIIMNKPPDYECSQKPKHHPSVYSLFPDPIRERKIQSIGRLDEDTMGLLLFSDDGQFIHRMESPKWKVPKIYEVTAKHPLTAEQIAALLKGVQLDDEPGPLAALACTAISDCVIHLTLGEGKYHQVKRMVAAIGNRVDALKRIAVGRLVLPENLAPGAWRWLEPGELGLLQ